jgi:ABC-type nickel/cobalt efflux system permease component RcnA/hydrogenase/urease accessory protein HupE
MLVLSPEAAGAHLVNTDVGAFYAGMMHPLTSVEHLLPALALALLASQSARGAARGAVILFPVALAAGILTGNQFPGLAAIHMVNLALLVLLGAVLIAAGRIAPIAAPIAALCTGLILGYRSGVDMAAAGVGMQFVPGVALTGLIIVALFAAWVPAASSGRARTARSLLGAGFSAAGLVLIISTIGSTIGGVGLHSVRGVGMPGQQDIVSLVTQKELSAVVVAAALTGSLIWGAGHALTPGHGKAIVAAYLVGVRSTPWHAVYLGLTVTATHTLVVFALGLIALFASQFIVPDQLYPWLGLVSGLIVAGMGATLALARLRAAKKTSGHVHGHTDHDGNDHHNHHNHHNHHDHHDHHDHAGHGHSHLPPDAQGAPVTWRSLLGLGISGGLLPCPAALVLLLAAVSFGRVGFGMLLVAVFSLGLAGVLIAVGLLFIKGGRLLARIPQVSAAGRWMPVISALVMLVIGVFLTLQAAVRIGVG